MMNGRPCYPELRIHFTEKDFARVVVSRAPDPMWETVLAAQLLAEGVRDKPVYARWYRHVRGTVGQTPRVALRMLHAIAPPVTYFPDFLTPAEPVDDLAAGLEVLRATPRRRLAHDIIRAGRKRTLPTWVRDLATGDQNRLHELSQVMRLVHEALVAPAEAMVQANVDLDWNRRSWAARTGGITGLLDSLRPVLLWEFPVLHARYPTGIDIHLNGRGLRLIPSYFCWGSPIALVDPRLAPTVVYPVAHTVRWAPRTTTANRDKALAGLLGRTRARVLVTLATTPATTGELAERLHLSPASVSEHTAVLRDAGLLHTQRHGRQALHIITSLGAAVRRSE